MTPERWQQIRDVLEKALNLAPEERSAFLNHACSSDLSLRQEVDTLLASSDDIRSSFLQSMPVPVTLAPGTRLDEYEIVVLVGSGGMGEVYRARDARLGRDVAIKVLPSLLSVDADRLRRFEQEARAAAALNHPNILAVYQMGTHHGAPYLVSELLQGETLRGLLKRGRISVRKAIDYAVQIAHGLAAAHEKGIVHRDLKPENLFVTRDGRVKILDFGLAKLTRRQAGSDPGAPTAGKTEPGVVMGTLGYMSPEQVRGQVADHRTDIFSFGAILYEMLTGKRAFQKPTSADTMTAILNEDPPSVSQVTTSIPAALQRVVHRCLEKNPEQRFQSASDLAFALDALSESSGYGSAAGNAKDAKPRTKVRIIACAAIVIVLAAALGLWRRWAGAKASPERHGDIIRRQLTANAPGDPVRTAAISRDGKYLAYATVVSKKMHVLQIDSGEVRELPSADAADVFDWFPDGSHLLVQRLGHPGFGKVSIWSGTYQDLFDGDMESAAVSPDGSHVAFQKGTHEIWLIGSDGEDPHKILALDEHDSLVSLAWSPRGRRLVYNFIRGQAEREVDVVETCDLEAGHRTSVLSFPDFAGASLKVYWLPDGRILSSTYALPLYNYDIWAVAADPDTGNRLGEPSRLTNWERNMPAILGASTDGKRLSYISNRFSEPIYLANLRSGGRRPSTQRVTAEDWNSYPGDWARDSRALLFDSRRDGRRVIFKHNISEQTSEALISGAESYKWPVLSPGGDRLLFSASTTVADSDPSMRLMTQATEGGVRSLLLSGVYSYHCAYLPSAGCVLGEAKGQQLVFSVLDPMKGKGAEIQRLDTKPLVDWSLSPDGAKIAIGDPDGWIQILTIAGNKIAPLPHKGTWTGVQHVTWAADGNHLFATAWSDSAGAFQAILSVDPHGNIRVVDEVANGAAWIEDMRASPDGHYLAYTKRVFESNVMMLENF